MASATVKVDKVSKRFSGHVAVDDVSMQVGGGGIFGLLGPNGAGKTTLIRMMMNIIEPDEGHIELLGAGHHGRELSHRIGYLPEERGLYKKMKVIDQLAFHGETRGIARREARARASAWLARLGIDEWADQKVEDLSKGMQQKVQFAGALLHEPELIILDEPFSGLDPVNSQAMRDIVVELAESGRTIIFSTHVMEQAERMCDEVVILAKGRKVVDGSVTEVKAEFGGHHVALAFSHDKARAEAILKDPQLIAKLDDYGASAEVELADGVDAEVLLHKLVAAGVGLRRFEVVEPSLQAVFVAKVGSATTAERIEEAA